MVWVNLMQVATFFNKYLPFSPKQQYSRTQMNTNAEHSHPSDSLASKWNQTHCQSDDKLCKGVNALMWSYSLYTIHNRILLGSQKKFFRD